MPWHQDSVLSSMSLKSFIMMNICSTLPIGFESTSYLTQKIKFFSITVQTVDGTECFKILTDFCC
jgi:hypothetical protein